MSETYTIKEISELFNIPKSTLRYWESEGLISSIRNDSNNYREYTNENLIKICDIIFYRNLNIPVKQLSYTWNASIEESKEFFINSCNELENQIKEIEATKRKIEQRLENLKTYDLLNSSTYKISSPPFKSISYLHLGRTKNVLRYLNDQTLLAFPIHIGQYDIEHYGIISNEISAVDNKILWATDDDSHEYLECLVKINDGKIDTDYLQKHLDYINESGKKPGIILARYLVSDNINDYFQSWIEII